jgi:hypothetical protein
LMTETQERFVRAILTRVPLDGVVELHLFPPIRRGTLETGVAVIAIELPPVALVVDVDDVPDTDVVDLTIVQTLIAETPVGADDAAALETVASEVVDTEPVGVETTADAVTEIVVADTVAIDVDVTDASEIAAEERDTDHSDAVQRATVRAELGESDAIALASEHGPSETFQHDDLFAAASSAAAETVVRNARAYRLRILTASYRLTVKGVERGKWIFDAQEEADAPLDAVEAVLRGVRHRSTEPADPELVSRDMMVHLVAPRAVAPAA